MTHAVQLMLKLTVVWGVNAHLFFNFLMWLKSKHAFYTKWTACESAFVYCMQAIFVCYMLVIIGMLHDSKKHVSNASCAVCESVFCCCMQVNSHLLPENDEGLQQKSTPAKRDKMCGHEENDILLSIYSNSL